MIGVFARQAVRCQHRDLLDGAVAHGVAQGIEAGSIEPAAAVAFVAEDVLRGYGMPSRDGPGLQGGELASDGLPALLALG